MPEDLVIGGLAGAAAAAATTPLDVVKTVMMCSATSRPTVISAGRTLFTNGGKVFGTLLARALMVHGCKHGRSLCSMQ